MTAFHGCQDWRRMVVRRHTLNLSTGEFSEGGPATVEVRRCGAPLFGADERASGRCRSCAGGFAVDGNRPATAAEIAAVRS